VRTIRSTAAKFGEDVEVHIYYTGKDVDYIRKYGLITRGTLIINGTAKLDNLSKAVIEKALADAVKRSMHDNT